MPRTLLSLALLVALCAPVIAPNGVQGQLSVEGAWTVTALEVGGETNSSPQRGIFIFTSTHYSFFFVNQPEPRAASDVQGNALTDGQKVVAFDEFVANAGRYTIEGNTLTTQAYMAKIPEYMGRWPDNPNVHTVIRDGDTMTLTFENGNVATLARREGGSPPG